MSRIGNIGTGHIAAHIARLMASIGHELHVTERNLQVSSALKVDLGMSIGAAQDVIDASDTIFLCLRPLISYNTFKSLIFLSDQKIVSVMAAVSENRLAALCAPTSDFVQTIRLGFLQAGGCPLTTFGSDSLLADLFDPDNPVVKVADEAASYAQFSACTMVPGLLNLMATGARWLADQTGDMERAEFYTIQLMSGFLLQWEKKLLVSWQQRGKHWRPRKR